MTITRPDWQFTVAASCWQGWFRVTSVPYKLPCFNPAFRRIVYTQEMQTNIYTFCSSEPLQTIAHHPFSKYIYIYSIEVIACIWTFPPLTWLQQNPTNILVMNNGWSNPSRVDTSQEVHNQLPSNIFFICIISQWWTYHHHLLVLYNWKDLCFIMFQLWIYQMDIWHLIYVQGFKHDYSLEHNHFYAPITSKGTHPSRHSAPLVPLQHLTCKGKKYHENPEISVVNGQDFS